MGQIDARQQRTILQVLSTIDMSISILLLLLLLLLILLTLFILLLILLLLLVIHRYEQPRAGDVIDALSVLYQFHGFAGNRRNLSVVGWSADRSVHRKLMDKF